MTDETKGDGMTLEQVRDDLRKEIEFQGQMGAYAATKVLSRYLRAINAYLAAQSAMRVDEDVEEVVVSLGDDAAFLRMENDGDSEIADNMERAAEIIESMRAALQAAIGNGHVQEK